MRGNAPDDGPRPAVGLGRGATARAWTLALAVLVPATSLAVASVSPWLVIPYLLAMAALLYSPRRSDPAPTPLPARDEPTACAAEVIPDVPASPEPEPEPEPASAAVATAEAAASKPKRGKGKGRAKATKSRDAVPVTWVKVGPGKFVRVEGAQAAGAPALDVPGPAVNDHEETPPRAEAPTPATGPEVCEPIPEPEAAAVDETATAAPAEAAVEAPALPPLEGWDDGGPSRDDAPPVGVHQEPQLECVSEPVEPERPPLDNGAEAVEDDDRPGPGGPAVEVVGEESEEVEAVAAGNAPDTSATIEPEPLPEIDHEPLDDAVPGGASPWSRRLLAVWRGRRSRATVRGRGRRDHRGSRPRRRGRSRPSRTHRRGAWTHHPRAPPDRLAPTTLPGRRLNGRPAPR